MEAGQSFPATNPGADVSISLWNRDCLDALTSEQQKDFRQAVDTFGVQSARAQGLPTAITDYSRLRSNPHNLYLACRRDPGSSCLKVLGGLKTGRKKLFVIHQAAYVQLEPVCVLDFFVHESVQRQGLGFQLFQAFLQHECQTAQRLGYDRPSPKLLHFLLKYFSLKDYTPQNNKYVVFEDYWQQGLEPESTPKGKPFRHHSTCEQNSPNLGPLHVPAACAMPSPPPQKPSSPTHPRRQLSTSAQAFALRPSTTPCAVHVPGPGQSPNVKQQSSPKSHAPTPASTAAEAWDRSQQSKAAKIGMRPGTSPAQNSPTSSGIGEQPHWNPLRPPWALHLPPRSSTSARATR